MEAIGLLVTLDARRGKEADAEAFLKSAQPLALDEKWTLSRNAHLSGAIDMALGARANELLAVPPQIEKVEVFAGTPLKG
jgi:hypothetical protein